MHRPHADDKRATVPGREPGRHVHQVPDRSGTTAGLSRDPSFHGNAATYAEREQSTGEVATLG